VSFIFFFQAEDGIRDRTVTGVQTCALPILVAAAVVVLLLAIIGLTVSTIIVSRERDHAQTRFELARRAVDEMYTQVAEQWLENRSEERRVGKEGRERGGRGGAEKENEEDWW